MNRGVHVSDFVICFYQNGNSSKTNQCFFAEKIWKAMKWLKGVAGFYAGLMLMAGCTNDMAIRENDKPGVRIVSLNGAISEIIASSGATNKLVGADVTSTYPESVSKLPKTGHNRNINAEAIIALKPTHIYTFKESMKPAVAAQMESAGIELMYFEEPKNLDGVRKLIKEVSGALEQSETAELLLQTLETDLAALAPVSDSPKVLFIYARGAGALSVAGSGTAVDEMLRLSGARNAAADVDGFKPYTSEAALKANPDVLLLFDSGLESLGGNEGLLSVPGIAQTNAGKTKRVYAMDGLLLSGFTPRTGKALQLLQSWWLTKNVQP
jgi:iron complex transport system substrate-binding protein